MVVFWDASNGSLVICTCKTFRHTFKSVFRVFSVAKVSNDLQYKRAVRRAAARQKMKTAAKTDLRLLRTSATRAYAHALT